jgi:hypothetical protein
MDGFMPLSITLRGEADQLRDDVQVTDLIGQQQDQPRLNSKRLRIRESGRHPDDLCVEVVRAVDIGLKIYCAHKASPHARR